MGSNSKKASQKSFSKVEKFVMNWVNDDDRLLLILVPPKKELIHDMYVLNKDLPWSVYVQGVAWYAIHESMAYFFKYSS